MVSDGHALSRLDICKAALPNKVYSGSSIPNFTGGNKSEVNTEDDHLIDGKRYNVEKLKIIGFPNGPTAFGRPRFFALELVFEDF